MSNRDNKLELVKETIRNLNAIQMKQVKGGCGPRFDWDLTRNEKCPTLGETCWATTCEGPSLGPELCY